MERIGLSEVIQEHGGITAVAKAAKLSTGAVWQYKARHRMPRLDTGIRLAHALDVSVDELVALLREEPMEVLEIEVRRAPQTTGEAL